MLKQLHVKESGSPKAQSLISLELSALCSAFGIFLFPDIAWQGLAGMSSHVWVVFHVVDPLPLPLLLKVCETK